MLVRAVRDRQSCDVTRDCLPDLLEERQHRGRAAHAVEADHVGTCVVEPPECISERPTFARHGMLVHRERDDRVHGSRAEVGLHEDERRRDEAPPL